VIFMFDSRNTSIALAKDDILTVLCDKYEANKRIMESFTTNTTTYRQLYAENESIVIELERLVIMKR
jgi:hypothetical protein